MIFLYLYKRSPLKNFLKEHFSQYWLMSSSDHVLLTYLLFKVQFLFPLLYLYLIFVSHILLYHFFLLYEKVWFKLKGI